MACYTVYLVICHNGMPANHLLTDLWFLVLGVVVIPQAIYSLCLLAKWGWCRARHRRVTGRNWIASLLACASAAAYLYGFFWGFGQLRVKHITLAYDQLPEAFDGYRIVHISDHTTNCPRRSTAIALCTSATSMSEHSKGGVHGC